MAAEVQIKLVAVEQGVQKTISSLSKQIDQLNATVEKSADKLNKIVTNTTINQFEKLEVNVQKTNVAINKFANSSQKTSRTVEKSNKSLFETYEDIRSVVIDAAKAFEFFKDKLLPVTAVLLRASGQGEEFATNLEKAILRLEKVIKRSIDEIFKAFIGLFQAKTKFGFLLALIKLNTTVNNSFEEVSKAANSTKNAISGVKDPVDSLTDSLDEIAIGFIALSNSQRLLIAGNSVLTASLAGTSKNISTVSNAGIVASNVFSNSRKNINGFTQSVSRAAQSGTLFRSLANVLKNELLLQLRLVAQTGFKALSIAIASTGGSVNRFLASLNGFRTLGQIGTAFVSAAKKTEIFEKGLIGTVVRTQLVGSGLVVLGSLLKKSENAFVSLTGTVVQFIGFALAPLAIVVQQAFQQFGSFVTRVGNDLVGANLSAVDSFQKATDTAFVFKRTISNLVNIFPDAASSTDAFDQTFKDLNETTGTSIQQLQRAATEIVATTADFGLAEDQIKQILPVANDFAALLGADVFDATLDVISGLNGASQSLIKYGINLKNSAIEQKLLNKGIKVNFEQLSEAEKVQVRFNVLLDQYQKVAGIAETKTNTFAGSQKILDQRIADLNVQFGEGVSLIEDTSISINLLTRVIESINPIFVKAAGFISALAGRFLQVTGVIIQFVFLITLTRTSINALNTLLASTAVQQSFFTKLPFINASFVDLLRNIGATNINLATTRGLVLTLGSTGVGAVRKLLASFVGLNAATATFSAIFRAAIANILISFGRLLAFFLTNPIGITILAIGAAVTILIKSFIELENRTKAVSETFSVIGNIFSNIFDTIFGGTSVLQTFANVFSDLFSRVIGASVLFVAQALNGLIRTINLLPDSIIGEQSRRELDTISSNIDGLSKRLIAANFDIGTLGEQGAKAGRKIAGTFDKTKLSLLKSKFEIARIRENLEFIGKNKVEIATAKFKKDISIIKRAIESKTISEAEGLDLLAKREISFIQEKQKIQENADKTRVEKLEAELNKLTSNPIKLFFDLSEGKKIRPEGVLGSAAGFLQAGQGGSPEEQAGGFISNVGGGVASLFFGEQIGGLVQQILGFLSQGPEAAREFIDGLIEGIPLVIQNIAAAGNALIIGLLEGLPVLIEGLLEGIPVIIQGIVDAIPRIIESIITLIPNVIQAIIQNIPLIIASIISSIPRIIGGLVSALINSIPKIINPFSKEMLKIPGQFLKELIKGLADGIKKIFSSIGGLFGGGGDGEDGGGGFLSTITFGLLQKGGLVPGSAAQVRVPGSTDAVPSLLTPGEFVIDRTDTRRLVDFLNRADRQPDNSDVIGAIQDVASQFLTQDGGSQNLNISINIGEEELANTLLNINRNGFRVSA